MSFKVVNVVVKMKLPGKADLIKLTGAVPNSSYSPESFPAAVVKDYEHDGERVSFLVFSSGNVICTGGKDPEKAKRVAKAFAKALMEKGVVERGGRSSHRWRTSWRCSTSGRGLTSRGLRRLWRT